MRVEFLGREGTPLEGVMDAVSDAAVDVVEAPMERDRAGAVTISAAELEVEVELCGSDISASRSCARRNSFYCKPTVMVSK